MAKPADFAHPRYRRAAALGAVLREIRNARRLDQSQVAEPLGLSARTYASYELGTTSITFETLVEICEVLRVDLSTVVSEQQRRERELTRVAAIPETCPSCGGQRP